MMKLEGSSSISLALSTSSSSSSSISIRSISVILFALCSAVHGYAFKFTFQHQHQHQHQNNVRGAAVRTLRTTNSLLHTCNKSFLSHHQQYSQQEATPCRHRVLLWNSFDDDNNNNQKDDSTTTPLGAFLEKASNTGLDNASIQVNSLVVTKYDLPQYGIFADQTYELKSVYLQGRKVNEDVNDSTTDGGGGGGVIDKISLNTLDLMKGAPSPPAGYTRYISLYSPMYHDNDTFKGRPVIVTPEEVGLISMKDEVLDSVLVAVPILSFWLGTIYVFANTYHQRTGGNFIDAFFGR